MWKKANKIKGVNLKHCVYVIDLLLPVDSPFLSPSLTLLPSLFWCVCSVDSGLDSFWVSALLTCGWSLTCRGWKITALLKAEMDSHSLLEPWPTTPAHALVDSLCVSLQLPSVTVCLPCVQDVVPFSVSFECDERESLPSNRESVHGSWIFSLSVNKYSSLAMTVKISIACVTAASR